MVNSPNCRLIRMLDPYPSPLSLLVCDSSSSSLRTKVHFCGFPHQKRHLHTKSHRCPRSTNLPRVMSEWSFFERDSRGISSFEGDPSPLVRVGIQSRTLQLVPIIETQCNARCSEICDKITSMLMELTCFPLLDRFHRLISLLTWGFLF